MKKTAKVCLSFVLAIALAATSVLTTGISAKAEEVSANDAGTATILKNEVTTMEITEDDLEANQYETYYWSSDIQYTYQKNDVEFISESQFTADGETYDLKNKETTIELKEDNGTVTISLTNTTTPIGGISGAWSSTYGGSVQLAYQTDISGVPEVRSEDDTNLHNSITLNDLADGTYHLTDGSIYERANAWSPGIDFDDGKGTVTEGYFGALPDITFTVGDGESGLEEGYIGEQTRAKVYDDFENDIWLQYQQKDLEVGETAEIYPWRTEQIVTDVINNDVARPNFHFDVIKGEDVVEVTPERSTDDTVALESGEYDKAKVEAKQAGTAVVKVTYDARDYKGKHWDAISKVNTGYVVFTVGETGTATIETNEEFADWQHYDTIYYSEGETTPYTFNVDTANAESVKVTVNGIEIQPNNPEGGYQIIPTLPIWRTEVILLALKRQMHRAT